MALTGPVNPRIVELASKSFLRNRNKNALLIESAIPINNITDNNVTTVGFVNKVFIAEVGLSESEEVGILGVVGGKTKMSRSGTGIPSSSSSSTEESSPSDSSIFEESSMTDEARLLSSSKSIKGLKVLFLNRVCIVSISSEV